MLVWHFVLVTQHGLFTISIDSGAKQIELATLTINASITNTEAYTYKFVNEMDYIKNSNFSITKQVICT